MQPHRAVTTYCEPIMMNPVCTEVVDEVLSRFLCILSLLLGASMLFLAFSFLDLVLVLLFRPSLERTRVWLIQILPGLVSLPPLKVLARR